MDCEDAECAPTRVCNEHCSNGVDDDGDGHVDCFDDECAGEPVCVEVAERIAGGSLYYRDDYRAGWDTYYSWGKHENSFVFEDLSMSMRWWEHSAWQSCRWGADRVTMAWRRSGAGSGWGWFNDVAVSESWSSECGAEQLPALAFYLGEAVRTSGAFNACRGIQVWGASVLEHGPGCTIDAWLSGSTTGYTGGSGSTSWDTAKGYYYGWTFTHWRSFDAPSLEPGPWSLE